MLPANLDPIEILDLGIHGESLAYEMYDRLTRQIQVPTLQTRFHQLKKDEKDHRKTLRAHRRALFGAAPAAASEAEAARIFGVVDTDTIRDKDSLIQVLYGAIRFEEYGAYFYEKAQYRLPSQETRIFLEVLASEGRTHAEIIRQQIETLRGMRVAVDERGRAVESC